MKKTILFFTKVIFFIVLIIALLNLGINYFFNEKLPNIILEKNDTDYAIEYESIQFSLLNSTLYLNNVKLNPKPFKNKTKKNHFKVNVSSIGISGIDFYKLFKTKNIVAESIIIRDPKIILYKSNNNGNYPNKKSNLPKSIDINKIVFQKANVKIVEVDTDTEIGLFTNLNISVDVLKMGDYIINKDLPFTYKNFEITCDSLFYNLNNFESIKSGKIHINPSNFEVTNLKILPSNSNTNKLDTGNSYEIIAPKLKLNNTDWKIDSNNLIFDIAKIELDSLKFDVLNKKVNSSSIKKENLKNNSALPFTINIDEIDIKNSSFKLLNHFDFENVNVNLKNLNNNKNNQFHIKELSFINPNIIYKSNKNTVQKNNTNHKPINYDILIDQFNIKNANYKQLNNVTEKFSIEALNLSVNKIHFNSEISKNKIPFNYQNLNLNTGKIHYNSGKYYDFYINESKLYNNSLTLLDLKLKPKLTKTNFDAQLTFGQDLYNLICNKVILHGFKFGFDQNNILYINSNQLDISDLDANIYRNSSIPNEPNVKGFFSKKLRDLKFNLEISKVKIANSSITYQEKSKKSKQIGALTFKNFNANISNIYSGFNKKTGPETLIDVNTKFMTNANVSIIWNFNILNRDDSFNIKGSVKDLNVEEMNPFLKPYLNISGTGFIEEVDFNFSGNNNKAAGTFAMNYEQLDLSIYKENNEKRKLLSDIANLVIKKNTHNKRIEHNTKTVERDKQKGFFSFFWQNLKQGLIQTLL